MGGKNKFDGNDQIKAGLNYYEHNAKVFRTTLIEIRMA
jgi:hypothetical protein